ncbi:MAG: hypothetical protein AB8B93_14835 [Pseudomonadales bacterium]
MTQATPLTLTTRSVLLVLFIVLCAIAWHGGLDRQASSRADALLTRALTTYAVARSLNGVISVAQGTEIAVQPVGVGVTITAGEILDPLNDLIERFSWLVLMATASLGVQLVLTDIFASPWLTGILTALVAAASVALFLPQMPGRALLLRACALALFARFLFALVTLACALANSAFLAERQDKALATLDAVTTAVAEVPKPVLPVEDPSMLDRLGQFIEQQADNLQIQERLEALQQRVESGVAEMINLIVVFTLQTLLFPAAALYCALGLFRLGWRWLWQIR